MQELAKRLQTEMDADQIYRKAVAMELLDMTKRWEGWTKARVSAPTLSLDDGCEADADAAPVWTPGNIFSSMSGLGPPVPVESGPKYRIWCVGRLREVERELMKELAAAAAASINTV